MVRINLVEPRKLADQHLIAEYNEILMLLGYARKYPGIDGIPESYCLGSGHIKFFKNKLLYLAKRHELIKKEMKKRGFAANKAAKLGKFDKRLVNDWKPKNKDFEIIGGRIIEKLQKKPEFYRYYGEYKGADFFVELIEE